MAGGSGTVTASLTFDDAGKLSKVQEKAKFLPCSRLICQAHETARQGPGRPLVADRAMSSYHICTGCNVCP